MSGEVRARPAEPVVQALQAEEEMRALHGGAGGGGGRGAAAGRAAVAVLRRRRREARGHVRRVQRRGHAAQLRVQSGRAVRAVLPRLPRVRAAAPPRAAPPRRDQPARRQQPPLRRTADVTELAAVRADPARTRGHLGLVVTVQDHRTRTTVRGE